MTVKLKWQAEFWESLANKNWFQFLILVGPALLIFLLPQFHVVAAISIFFFAALIVLFTRAMVKRWNALQVAQLEQRRLEAKAFYFEAIVSQSANIIFTTDSDHRVMKFNPGAERVFGISQAEALGREVKSLFAEPDALEIVLREVENIGLSQAPELRIPEKSGAPPIWLSAQATRMRGRNQEFIGEVFHCADITLRKRLEDELLEKNEQLLRLSVTDALTGLYNVRHLRNELERLLRARRRFPQRSLSIAMIDLDKFKQYNDTLGHPEGDKLLQEVSKLLKAEIREGMDLAFRIGGDEFLLVLPDTREEGAQSICDRILGSFAKGEHHPAGLSIGIACDRNHPTGPDLNQAFKSIMDRADKAMYHAKQSGGSRLELSPPGP